MREIKFRVWCKQYNSYKKPDEPMLAILALSGEYFGIVDGQYAPLRKENYVLEQYTGLKDKNEVEIYEGDIVEVDNELANKDHRNWLSNPTVEIKQLSALEAQQVFVMLPYLEVIGNIHQNPELISSEEGK